MMTSWSDCSWRIRESCARFWTLLIAGSMREKGLVMRNSGMKSNQKVVGASGRRDEIKLSTQQQIVSGSPRAADWTHKLTGHISGTIPRPWCPICWWAGAGKSTNAIKRWSVTFASSRCSAWFDPSLSHLRDERRKLSVPRVDESQEEQRVEQVNAPHETSKLLLFFTRCALCHARKSAEFSVQFLAPERCSSRMASPKALPIAQNVLALPR